jgi:hypothetical protein
MIKESGGAGAGQGRAGCIQMVNRSLSLDLDYLTAFCLQCIDIN